MTRTFKEKEQSAGESWRDDKQTYAQVGAAWDFILSAYGPRSTSPTKPALDLSRLGEDVARVLVGGLVGSQTRSALAKDGTPEVEPKTAKE